MASLKLNGPYDLDEPTIDSAIRKESAGTFVIGMLDDEGTFVIEYVGRADSDLNSTLKAKEEETDFTKFKFIYTDSAEEAFTKECEIYHDFEPPANEGHPQRPEHAYWKCPRCDIY